MQDRSPISDKSEITDVERGKNKKKYARNSAILARDNRRNTVEPP